MNVPMKTAKTGKVLVTGGGGFIGSHLVDAILAQGNEVLVIDDFSTGRESNLERAKRHGQLAVEKLDICESHAAKVVATFKPQIIFHLAAQMNVRRSVSEPLFDAKINVLGILNLLEAAKNAAVERFIFASTGGAIYGEQEQFPAPEGHAVHPECPYGVSKRAGEEYLEYYSRVAPMVGVSLRYANVYGPRQNPKGEAGVVAIFSEKLHQGKPLVINGDGKQTRDFVSVHDVVQSNILAAGAKKNSGFFVYNVGTGMELSILSLAEEMAKAFADGNTEITERISISHGPALPGEQRRSVVCPKKIETELGWKARIGLQQGLLETIESFSH